MRLTIYNIQHSDFGIYKCVGRLGGQRRSTTMMMHGNFFNFWHHLIFMISWTAAKNPRGETESSIRLYCKYSFWWQSEFWWMARVYVKFMVTLWVVHAWPSPWHEFLKWQTFFIILSPPSPELNLEASQPPTTVTPPTTELVETTSSRKIVSFLPPVGQTTMYTFNMIDKGEGDMKRVEVLNFNQIHLSHPIRIEISTRK